MEKSKIFDGDQIKYLSLLAKSYPNIDSVSSKIIDLSAVLHMPKATEHFVSDVHGEYDAFGHVIKNASGVIKNYIEELYSKVLTTDEKSQLATLIYYPQEKLYHLKELNLIDDDWYRKTIMNLIGMTRRVGSKYNREKVKLAFPRDLYYVLEELLFESPSNRHKGTYYNTLIDQIIELEMGDKYIIALATLTKRFAVEHLHVVGDIYDRGDKACAVMDFLVNHHDADIQWGNHDIAWIGAASGNIALIANVVRIAARYDNLSTLEDDYGINLVPLITLAMKLYKDDPCKDFIPKAEIKDQTERELVSKIHKAISIIQFKAEAQLILEHPEFKMDHRILLNSLSSDHRYIEIKGTVYELLDSNFPTFKESPIVFTPDEEVVVEKLKYSFTNSTKLQEHIKFMVNKGSIYKIANDNVLYHGCVPLNEDGSIKETNFLGKPLKGKELLDELTKIVKAGFFEQDDLEIKDYNNDIMWYLWCGPDSPLFGKDEMTTFERYFIDDKSTHKERKNSYYKYRDNEKIVDSILKEFNIISPIGKLINGHVPVKASEGENPVKANGKLIVIDGGFSKPYQKVTGIGGFTLISNSYGLLIAQHQPFVSKKEAVESEAEMTTKTEFVLKYDERRKVASTDLGTNIMQRISDLKDLLTAYKTGQIAEKQ
ncbi:MAG: fructose-1,6-bisphosphatase [Tissierellia bacterium]|nr:fructose-1,6-bisphosphatase [Tissierellia bacterium]